MLIEVGDGGKKVVDASGAARFRFERGDLQGHAIEDDVGTGRGQVNFIGFEDFAVFGFDDGDGGLPEQQFLHQRFVIGGEVLNNDKCAAGLEWGCLEKQLKGFESAGGSADTDDVDGIRR